MTTDSGIQALLTPGASGVTPRELESHEDRLSVTVLDDGADVLDDAREDRVDCLLAGTSQWNGGRSVLDRLADAGAVGPAVVLFGEDADAETLERAIDAGVDRYVDLGEPGTGVGDLAVAAVEIGEAAAAERDQFRTAFDRMPTSGFVLDDQGVTIAVNDTFCERTGYDREEVLGKPLDELPGILPEADRERTIERFDQLSDGEVPPPEEIEYRTKDGDRRYAVVESVPVFEDGEFEKLIGTSRDVTELKTRERELARQNERLERFAGILSHDLRNHLEVLTAEVELARLYEQSADFDRIENAVARMHEIVDDVLTMARGGGAVEETEPVSLSRLARECWQGIETGDATLSVEDDATIACDASRLRDLLENLYRNSVEHGFTGTGPAGDDAGAGPRVRVGTVEDGDRFGFYVEDDGPGIDPEDREAVFEPGYTTDEDGTGFGLNVVEEMAQGHGWTVEVSESDSGGARFEFTGVAPA
jgi:PAS domain S-box-containing protein